MQKRTAVTIDPVNPGPVSIPDLLSGWKFDVDGDLEGN
jgi:hypothetical protein